MIGLDTNILVRHLTQDDPVQSPIASHILEAQLTRDAPGFVSIVTLVETLWVLRSNYDVRAPEAAAIVRGLLGLDNLVIEHEAEVGLILTDFEAGAAEFSDLVIGALNLRSGCSGTLTFDRKAARLAGFQLAR